MVSAAFEKFAPSLATKVAVLRAMLAEVIGLASLLDTGEFVLCAANRLEFATN